MMVKDLQSSLRVTKEIVGLESKKLYIAALQKAYNIDDKKFREVVKRVFS